jgi:transposase
MIWSSSSQRSQPLRKAGGRSDRLEITLDELRQVRDRAEQGQFERDDYLLIFAVFSNEVVRAEKSDERRHERIMAKIAAAAAAAGASGPGPGPDVDASSGADESTGSSSSGSGTSATSSSLSPGGASGSGEPESRPHRDGDAAPADAKSKPKGHGRNGASAYRHAQHFSHTLAPGVIGAQCEACRLANMSRYREKITIRIVGQPLFGAEGHHYEQGRCRNCGHIVRAEGPDDVNEGLGTDYIRYDWSACAMLMVMHYFGGAPFKRMESLHEGWGVPMPDANQWEVVNAGDDLLLPLYKALEQHAIQKATNFRIDDTGAMVIALKRQIAAEIAALTALGESTKDVRTGINATGLYWETPNGPVILFYTGRHHAGEIVDRLLRHRLVSRPKLVKCTDGASKNFDHEHADKLVESTCNAHALLKFRDIKDKHPIEYAEAGRVYKQVFDNDDEARALGLTPVDRMLYHREHSKPLMQELKKMCEEKITSKLVEPSSRLWEPLTFIINQWDRLTRFCDAPGVPLDTNLVEQALIMPVRYFAGSFNYHTEDGAVVGDHAMSLIATARANDVEPVAYLTECLRCHEDLAKNPDQYLPWVYRERRKDADASKASPRAPPCEAPRRELELLLNAQPTGARATQGLRDLAPELRKGAARRVAAPDQHL